MTPEVRDELRALEVMTDSEIDTSDPDAQDFSAEEGWVRGKFFRPIKTPISIRIDMDVLDWFKQQKGPYQVLINKVLRGYMESQKKDPSRPSEGRITGEGLRDKLSPIRGLI